MRKYLCLLMGICLCFCLAFCLAEGEWTAPEGKTEGVCSFTEEDLTGYYIYGTHGNYYQLHLYPVGRQYEADCREPVTRGSITMVSGDEKAKDLIVWEDYTDSEEPACCYVRAGMEVEGDPTLSARFRLEAESEHYYTVFEFDATFVSCANVSASLGFDRIQLPVGQEVVIFYWVNEEEITVEPQEAYRRCYIHTADGESQSETDGYNLRNPYIQVNQPGEYPMMLAVSLGINNYEIEFPITVEGVESLDLEGRPVVDSSGSGYSVQKTGQTEAEVTGDGDASDDSGLTLALDNGDAEFTVYAGSGQTHLSIWDIADYDKLSAAWGGTPGWSIMPEEGSEDVMRWSNGSLDGKSIWAFYDSIENVKCDPGDYSSVLTCTWHGQSASAKITVHVVDSPNGVLEGITGLEESYTLALGDTIHLDIQPVPAGWTLPGETEQIRFWNIYSVLEDEYIHNSKGTPWFAISLSDGFGPGTIKAQRSGVYEITFNYQCGSFSGTREVTFNVLNADGSLPQSAAEITETEGAQFAYETAEDPTDGSTFIRITGGKAVKDLRIPAELEGLPVKEIGNYAFLDSNSPGASETIETLEIEEGIENIGYGAFRGCVKLKSIKLPESLKQINSEAFADCRSLTDIQLPSTLAFSGISYGAFNGIGAEDIVLADGTSLLAKSLADSYYGYISTYADGWCFRKLEDGTAKITAWADSAWNTTELTIPATVAGYPVSTLTEGLFRSWTNLQKVTLPESLQRIEKDAFRGCTSLTEINLPESLLEVATYAFAETALEGVSLPEGAREQSSALWYVSTPRTDSTGFFTYGLIDDGTVVATSCTPNGSKLEIPAELDGFPVAGVIGLSGGFVSYEERGTVTEIVLPEGLRFIGEDAFESFDNLKKISFPDSLTIIGTSAFRSCSSLTELRLPEGLREIGDEAFMYVPLTAVQFPESLVSIGSSAFTGNKMTEIEIPASVETLGNAAFDPNGGTAPKKVTFCNPLTEIGCGVFGHSMRSYEYGLAWDDPENWFDFYAESGRSTNEIITIVCYPGSTADAKYRYNVKKQYLEWGEESIRTAPEDRILRAGLFRPDEMIYELTVPEGVEEIEEGALSGLRTLSKVTLPSTLTTIGSGAFEGCISLKTINLPDSLVSVGTAVFKDCQALESIVLPASVTEIPDSMFENCEALTGLKIKAKVLTAVGNNAFNGCTSLSKFDFKKGLTAIGDGAFMLTGLKKAQIPDTVTSLGTAAFSGSAITGISLPKGLEAVPDLLCFGAVYLKEIKFSSTITSIGNGAFAYCALTGLKLPEGLISIGDNAFRSDADGVSNYYAATQGKRSYTSLKALKLPASLQSIGANAFACNDALTSVSFAKNASLETIGYGAFGMCLHLKEIQLPDSVQSIGEAAFVNCLSLKKADLGSGVTSIGPEAFLYDDALTSLKVPDTATELGENILEGHGEGLTVICGEGSAMEAYVQANAPDVQIAH